MYEFISEHEMLLMLNRTSTSNYIVPYNRYMESTMINYSVGMRFLTRFEGEDGHAER